MALIKISFVFIIVLSLDPGVQSEDTKVAETVSNSKNLSPIRALFYPTFKRTTIEEQRVPLFKYWLPISATTEQKNKFRNELNFLQQNQRKKRSVSYGYSYNNPTIGLNSAGYGNIGSFGYGGYAYPYGYPYTGSYGLGNYGYGYGTGYGSGYANGYGNYGNNYGNTYDPYCDYY